jgi:hypothetical protein
MSQVVVKITVQSEEHLTKSAERRGLKLPDKDTQAPPNQ